MGGNVAENTGGPRALKYGVTREYVLGLEVVIPTGEILRVGRRTIKGVAGYDLTALFVDSEGTLGHRHRDDGQAPAPTAPRVHGPGLLPRRRDRGLAASRVLAEA